MKPCLLVAVLYPADQQRVAPPEVEHRSRANAPVAPVEAPAAVAAPTQSDEPTGLVMQREMTLLPGYGPWLTKEMDLFLRVRMGM